MASRQEIQRRYRERHGDRVNAACRAWYSRNQEEQRARCKRYRAEHPNTRKTREERQISTRKAHRERMLAEHLKRQHGICAICGSAVTNDRWHLDHDAQCCKSECSLYRCGSCERGALCENCNRGLGMFHEEPEALRAAADYIEAHRERSTE